MMQLPKANEPLVLASGKVVMPGDGTKRTRFIRPTSQEIEQRNETPVEVDDEPVVLVTQRKLSDLPETPRNMNPICVIIAYTMFGLTVPDISQATNLTEEQVENIQRCDAFVSMRDTLMGNVIQAEAASVREMFVKQSRAAVHVMVDSLHNGARATRMSAAKDILDRAGHRPADIIDHRHSINGGLVIEVVRKTDGESVPTIEMEIGNG
jgi:hypothetical protein